MNQPSATVHPRTAAESLKQRPEAAVLVLGGGINGVAIFRDLALQGVDVALVERADYCQGASGASSHMIHGGIRYLENGEFRLVRESVIERNGLLKLAPHYVKPLETTIPVFSTFSGILAAPRRFLTHRSGRPQERGAVLIKLGLSVYDFFSRDGGTVPRHRFTGRRRALQELPALRPDVKYAATYFDASVHNPERLTLDLLREGASHGPTARAANYVSAVGRSESGIVLRDEVTGDVFTFAADVVVNTTGAWVDLTNSALGWRSRFMGGTKGSHIVLDHPELLAACAGREIFFEHSDGRIVLIYPMEDRVLVGTTDIDADINEPAVCTEEEVEYFFDLIRHVFPTVPVSRDHIVYRFSGIRPLPAHDDTQPGFVSRDYRIERAPGNILSVVGGKWTTFRALAEHVTDEVLELLGGRRTVPTSDRVIGGGAGFPATPRAEAEWVARHASDTVSPARARSLLRRYGTRAAEVISYLRRGADLPFTSSSELSSREISYMVEHEQVVHLIDVLVRRTSLAFRGLVTAELLAEIASVLAPLLGWSSEQQREEVRYAERVMADAHGVQIQSLIG